MISVDDIQTLDGSKAKAYFMPSSAEETERLSILHKVFFEPTKRFLSLTGILDNNHSNILVADVGCGIGKMTKWLSENVNGSVIGFDNDEKQIAKAMSGTDQLTGLRADFEFLDIQSDVQYCNKFDLVYCRFLLHHLSNPLQGLINLVEMSKVGGKIVIGEPIMDGRWIYPNCDEYYAIYDLHLKNQSNHVWDPNYGRRLLSDVSDLDDVKVISCEQFRPILSTEEFKRHHVLVLDIFGEDFVRNGLITTQNLIELKSKSLEISKDSRYVTDLFGMVLICLEKI